MREWIERAWMREGIIVLSVGIAAAALGPYGTAGALPPAPRAFYWVALIALGWAQFVGTAALLDRYARLSWAARLGATIGLASLPLAIELTLLNSHIFGAEATPGTLFQSYWQAALIGTLILVPMSLLRRREPERAASAPASARPGERFFERIPPHIRGRLLALEMEDHYLRIHTEAGSALILHRMGDAVAELEGTGGWRVHRSWWVAAEAVIAARREKTGRTTLLLANGLEVPVSRSALASVRERLRDRPGA